VACLLWTSEAWSQAVAATLQGQQRQERWLLCPVDRQLHRTYSPLDGFSRTLAALVAASHWKSSEAHRRWMSHLLQALLTLPYGGTAGRIAQRHSMLTLPLR